MLSNKNIIVTGSSSGIGLSITKALLKNKANVLGISRRAPSLSNKNYQHIKFDLSKIEIECEKLSNLIKQKPIYGLISNAGSGRLDSLENFSPKQISEFISLNLNSHIIITRLLLPYFKKNNNGYISLSEALKTGVGTSIISALILSIYTIILIQYLDPEFLDKSTEYQKQKLLQENPEISIENVDKMFDMQKEFSGPFIISGFIIIFNLFFGFIISLIVGLILKKSQPE